MNKAILLWHQDSPGMKVWVIRGFWGRFFRNKDFASVGEKIYYNELEASNE